MQYKVSKSYPMFEYIKSNFNLIEDMFRIIFYVSSKLVQLHYNIIMIEYESFENNFSGGP
jgi:hypothetical protein